MDNLKPKKHLGQHFLTDQRVARKIVDCLQADATDTVAEIGPGEGVLTGMLAERFEHLKLIEVDPDAVEFLTRRFEGQPVEIIHTDVLKWRIDQDLPKDGYVIGNLPYNISSPIFFHLLDYRDYVKEGVFMIQKEVAQRICADPGSKVYGILSVLIGAYYDLKYEFSVPPGVFRPPPKVVSGVLRMVRRPQAPDVDPKALKKVVKAGFNQRRKTLRNALKSLEFEPFDELPELLTKRAEQLDVDTFVKLANHLKS
ncbi:16S rRNA (adenine(1518)-N(6)/adenine(1519)-N(6))-dimethyltransferase RsmA [Pontibacter sp. G13]|uniref:16S rRNA (adenine(1518)-N(6)/adenine(1519)-N(6))- dimethyltransferase RsmA n=1 Tax=Pontibacter sp. G13 TaxID=3074898 RepID=UPI00288C1D00|nr:16S rRNA (adenine(1518)-N(6)/adenine(1519)-N(6))-dimethyltransferase RsmA [Pontibacter sp. G13]WNJ21260.1 16S rRNA (adenine(1518)-N(6)/adenine(1519)-N(6))-dimethyltransferase RsmA [Pontibacter sp. G13]